MEWRSAQKVSGNCNIPYNSARQYENFGDEMIRNSITGINTVFTWITTWKIIFLFVNIQNIAFLICMF